jgi:hypothetical protein
MSGFVKCTSCDTDLFHEAEGSPEARGVVYHWIQDDLILCEICHQDYLADSAMLIGTLALEAEAWDD